MKPLDPDEIDKLLPQTQCGLCGFAGCRPYAEALAEKEASINLCPPGGIQGLLALSDYCGENAEPFMEEMKQKEKFPHKAIIREAECIGCTKCIKACPVDAIIGSAKSMHTIITDQCTGCELCIAPCPVDCIDMVPTSDNLLEKRELFRKYYLAKEKRLKTQKVILHTKKSESIDKKNYVAAALARIQHKKA